MTLWLLPLFLFLLFLVAGASLWGYHVFTLLIIILSLFSAVSLAEILFLRKKLTLGPLGKEDEVGRGTPARFILPMSLDSRWLPARLRLTARHGAFDKSLTPQRIRLVRNLRPGDLEAVDILIESRHTGSLILDDVLIEVFGLFGVFKFKKRFRHSQEAAEILVLPLTRGGMTEEIRALDHVHESRLQRRRTRERSDEVDTMRDYRSGDDIRTLHWPLSARMASPIVKEYEVPVSARTHLILDDFTGYSLETDRTACHRALTVRDRMLDAVATSLEGLLAGEMEVELHLGLHQTARERLNMVRETIHFRRILAHLPPDSLPDLGQTLGRMRGHDSSDRYLLFSRRLSEASAAAMAQVSRQVSQLIFFYFEAASKSREEDNALRIIRQSKAQLVLIKESTEPGERAGA